MPVEKSGRRIFDAPLLRVIVEQFVARVSHPLSDIRQFEQLALGLIDIVDAETVARICRPLCFHPETPRGIYDRLLDKGGPCAELSFEFAPAHGGGDMRANAEQGPVAIAMALARRRNLGRDVVAALAARTEPPVLRALAENRDAHIDSAARRALALAARDDVSLARILLDRVDFEIDPEPLFLAATRSERMAITLDACRRTFAAGVGDPPRHADPAFVAQLEEAARRGDREDMVSLLADALDCRKDRARAILADTLGDALALALAALGVDPLAATRIFLCADPLISHDSIRVRALVALLRSTPPRAAMRVVSAIVGAYRPERDPQRGREESGWRRVAMRATTARKLDQTG